MIRPLALGALLALSACGEKAPESAEERKTAAGEVLGGSISDAMLPLDTVTSQSPPLREVGGSSDAGAGDESDGANAPPRDSNEGPGEPPRESAPAPDPTPTPTAEPAQDE